MNFIYLLGIRLFHISIKIASLFNPKAKLWLKGRKNIFEELKNNIRTEDKIAWFHCASLGEFEQGRPVIESFKSNNPDYKVLLTFYSPSGYEIRKNYEYADYVFYLPLDTPGNAKRFLNIVNPAYVFFIKYEFWYFFLNEINIRKIPLYLVSGIFRKNHRFFKRQSTKSRKMLGFFTHFFVQNEESKKLLESINIKNVSVTGDTRFDRVFEITQQSKNLPLIEKFAKDSLVIIAGSTWKPDEELLIKYFNERNISFKVIIAPHEIHKENINRIIKSINGNRPVLKYSESNEENISRANVLIIDSIGILSSVYKYGDIAYIGGGFGKGIHNILEAATFGMPIIFGPAYQKFKEAVDLIKLGGAIAIENYTELSKALNMLIDSKEKIKQMSEISSEFVHTNKGATAEIIHFIKLR